MNYSHLTTELSASGVLLITMNRPQAANALNQQMAEEIAFALDSSVLPKERIAVIVLSGKGQNFCAGADLKERQGMNKEQWQAQHAAFEQARDAILNCPLPIIAAVGGAAVGGGLELALACDFIYASFSARFALTEATLGIMPGLGGTKLLPQAIGKRRAGEMLFSGEFIKADEALRIGLVNKLFADDDLLPEALKTAARIAANAPLAVKAIKASLNEQSAGNLHHDLQNELKHYNKLLETKDRYEGINAFNEKRQANFTGQ